MDCMKRLRTIKDLADLAQVSTGTVSRALAGSQLISARTRERIQALAAEHRFTPNLLARSLRTQRSGSVGVLIPVSGKGSISMANPALGSMIELVSDALATQGYNTMLRRTPVTRPGWLADVVDSGRVDGVILLGTAGQSATIDAVAEGNPAIVAWDVPEAGHRHGLAGSDYRAGGRLAAGHLIAGGARRILVCSDNDRPAFAERLEGCRQVAAEAGAEVIRLAVGERSESRRAAIAAAFDGSDMPDGVVAASDLIAMSVLSVLAERGIAVPGQVRVVGFDGTAFAEEAVPPLTTISQDFEGIAKALVDTLLARIGGEHTEPVKLAPQLVVRASA